MSRYAVIEDGVLAALDALRVQNGGPLRTLETTGQEDMDQLLERLFRARPPACFVIAEGMRGGPLRPGGLQDQQFAVSLLLGSRNFRGQKAARRGAAGEPGVYDLLDATRNALTGHQLSGLPADVLIPGNEKLFTSGDHMVVWRQDWTVTLY